MPTDARTAAEKTPLRCPACGVPLRLRERRFLGATFPCPACHELLVLTAMEAHGPVIQRAAVLSTQAPTTGRSVRLAMSAGLGALAIGILVGWMWWDREPEQQLKEVAAAAPAPIPILSEPSPASVSEGVPVVAPASQSSDPPTSDPLPSQPATDTLTADEPPEPPVSALTVATTVAPFVAPRTDHRILLSQRLVSFQQVKPVSRRTLLATIEDLLDRPVHVNDDVPADVAARLDVAVTFGLENVTVEELLRSILNGTGLEFTCTADDVQLRVARP